MTDASTTTETAARHDTWLTFALACCDAADALALEHFRRDLVIETKPDRTFVTQADTAIERTVRGLITLALLIAFVALVVYVYGKRRKATFDEMARMPLEDDPPAEDRGSKTP